MLTDKRAADMTREELVEARDMWLNYAANTDGRIAQTLALRKAETFELDIQFIDTQKGN